MAECCANHGDSRDLAEAGHGTAVRDPVCGMTVDTRTATHRHALGETTYYFCSAGCLAKFAADPDRYLNRVAR